MNPTGSIDTDRNGLQGLFRHDVFPKSIAFCQSGVLRPWQAMILGELAL